jgi:hypothetical protein
MNKDLWKVVTRQMMTQITDQCVRKWDAGDRRGPTFREHALAYFVPSPASLAFLKGTAPTAESAEVLKTFYVAAIEAQRLTWQKYTTEQADMVYRDWKAGMEGKRAGDN